uniref:Uncharacterized protein n=1 Tax=Triticum urartu TaxID=4572 RepID=A0A8R7THZ8_TRIUA
MADGANPNPTSTPRQKAVPDWLNSPIWSAPAPSPRHRSPPPPSPPPPPPPKPQHDPTPPPPRQPARRDGASSDSDSDSGGGDEGAATSSRTHLVAEFKAALERKVVDLAELRRLACQGVPDDPAVRPVVWKVWEFSHFLRITFSLCVRAVCLGLAECLLSHSHASDMTLARKFKSYIIMP